MTVIEQLTAAPDVAVRRCGLPAAALRSLRWEESHALVLRLLAEGGRLSAEGERLAEELTGVVGELDGSALRPVVIGLRRALHARRTPKEWNAEVRAALPEGIARRIEEWTRAMAAHGHELARLPGLVERESAAKQDELRAIAADPGFRRGLALAGPELAAELDRWIADPARTPKPQKLIRLAKYVARAAAKTSPYSMFTGTGPALWGDSESVHDTELLPVLEPAGHPRPETLPALVRLNPSATVIGDRVEFVGPPPDEPLVGLGLTDAVRACLRAVEGTDWTTLDDLAAALGADHASVARFAGALLRAGLLEPHPAEPARDDLAQAQHTTDPARFRRLLADIPGELHEVAVSTTPMATLRHDRWQERLHDLDVVRRWLAVFDAKTPMRLAVADLLHKRYGTAPKVPFLTLHRLVQEAVAASDPELSTFLAAAWTQPLAGSSLPLVRELDRFRAEARTLALSAEDATGTSRVPIEALEAQLAERPAWIATPRSSACYVQVAGDDLVLNVIHGGHGRALRRLDHLIERASGLTVAPPLLEDPEGAVYAELTGSLGSTLNNRPPSTLHQIDYPHSPAAGPGENRLPLRDLHVVIDPATGLPALWSDRLGLQVVPLHLGMAAEFQLPPAARFIERVFGPGYLLHPSSPPLIRLDRVPGTVTRYPRVEAGRVVVQRRRWLSPAADLPMRAKGEGDAAFLLRLAAWLGEHGIPERTFVRAWPEQTGAGQDKARKPLYLDLGDLFLVKVFERQVRGCAFALFEEALPDPLDVQDRVTEYLVEVGR
ncbi:lantibiotic dehydratase [Nonomuraea sediminis]|uniref:lantibiotic dehydratase n=1 Tax=Nonomuraea sediminis TaxID=2835864 RepID=UPI001BDC2012|nr:lantibiotic dehydratase [Nonomuraea sediminis]